MALPRFDLSRLGQARVTSSLTSRASLRHPLEVCALLCPSLWAVTCMFVILVVTHWMLYIFLSPSPSPPLSLSSGNLFPLCSVSPQTVFLCVHTSVFPRNRRAIAGRLKPNAQFCLSYFFFSDSKSLLLQTDVPLDFLGTLTFAAGLCALCPAPVSDSIVHRGNILSPNVEDTRL